MLDELHVRNIALVNEATLRLSPRLTVLTGETGAGKTALLSALRLISGQRADSSAVRDGADEALVEARFIEAEAEHVVRRRLTAQGRSRCVIDGEMATVGQLSAYTDSVRMHNQHEQVALLHPQTQLAYLDDAISADGIHLEAYRQALAAYASARSRFEELKKASETEAAQLDYYAFVLSQIDAVDPQEGEYERIEAELPRMQHAESLAMAAQDAFQAMYSDGAALDELARALQSLQRKAGIDPELDALYDRLADIEALSQDLASDLRAYREGVQFDPEALRDAQQRIGELSGLMKRYGPGMEQVLETRQRARDAIDMSQTSPERLQRAQAQRDKAEDELKARAAELTACRQDAAMRMCQQLAASVKDLAMPDASFAFSFAQLPLERWTESGPDSVELLYAPSAGSTMRALSKIASGGELSRILLALECVHLAACDRAQDLTLVFDEVDAGIGGVTGEAVARRLNDLAQSCQVVVVTHLPQVAAYADEHLLVRKQIDDNGQAVTEVAPVQGEERVAEIARMMAGMDDATGLEHARTLMEHAREAADGSAR